MCFTAYLLTDFDAIAFPQVQVEKHEVWPCFMPALDRLFAIKGPDHVISLALEPEAQQVYQVAVMIGYHDFHRVAPVGIHGANKLVIALGARLDHREAPLFLGNAARQALLCHLFPEKRKPTRPGGPKPHNATHPVPPDPPPAPA